MSEPLDEVSAADGGAERWHAVTAITAQAPAVACCALASPAEARRLLNAAISGCGR